MTDDSMIRAGDLADVLKPNPMGSTEFVWQGDASDAPVPGDSVTFGHFTLTPVRDTLKPVDAYSTYRGNLEDGAVLYVEVPFTSWGDYAGDSVSRSNCEALREDFPDVMLTGTGMYGYETLLIPSEMMIPEHLFDAIVSIANDYPLYDESHHSDLEQRLVDEDWDSYGEWDLSRELQERGVDEETIESLDLRQEWYDALEWLNLYPHPETAVSCFLYLREAAEVIAQRIAH